MEHPRTTKNVGQPCVICGQPANAQATVEALQAQLEAAERHNTILQDANKVALEKVEALQAEKLMLERGVSAQSALIDGLQSQLIQRTAALEAVQHERDEANSHVKFLGATKQANGSFCLDMKKYHARYRCGRHRDDPWKGIDTEIDCFVCLKHDLDAEREKVKGLHEITKVICTHCCEPMEIPSKAVLQSQLTQRTAALEAAKAELEQERVRLASCLIAAEGGTKDIVKQGDYGWSPAYQATLNLQAELERVRGERDEYAHKTKMLCLQNGPLMIENHDMKKLIAALPKVEGAVVVSNGYVKDSTRCHALFGADEDAALYAALLQHRQGMEG